jgi:hypothetical protein
MGDIFVFVLTLALFSLSSRGFAKALVTDEPWVLARGEFSLRARRFERSYKVFAWGLLTLSLLVSLVHSFLQVLLFS